MGGKPDAIVLRITYGNTMFLPCNRKTGSLQAREIFFDYLGPTPAFRRCLYTRGSRHGCSSLLSRNIWISVPT